MFLGSYANKNLYGESSIGMTYEKCLSFMQRGEIEYRCSRRKGHVGSHRVIVTWNKSNIQNRENDP